MTTSFFKVDTELFLLIAFRLFQAFSGFHKPKKAKCHTSDATNVDIYLLICIFDVFHFQLELSPFSRFIALKFSRNVMEMYGSYFELCKMFKYYLLSTATASVYFLPPSTDSHLVLYSTTALAVFGRLVGQSRQIRVKFLPDPSIQTKSRNFWVGLAPSG